jgi:hypothetical protein
MSAEELVHAFLRVAAQLASARTTTSRSEVDGFTAPF